MSFDQIVIFICGTGGLFMSNAHWPNVRKWAPVVGISAQPFWFYATYTAEQWGIFASSILYTAAWAFGIYNNFFRKPKP